MKNFRLLSGLLALGAVLPGSVGATSLWTAAGSREQGVATDHRAARVGDILTIIIAETASQSASQNKQTGSDAAINANVAQFLFPSSVSALGTHKGALPGIDIGATNNFQGGGQVSNSQTINARSAVLIREVLPNGNFVIEGARRLSFSGETQHVVLRGVVRPQDIGFGNTLLSSNIADAHLEFLSEGSLTQAQKRGWLSRLYAKLRPF